MIFPDEKRSEPRAEAGEYLSVEFKASKTSCLYQFKLRNVSSKGICLLIREDSDLLKKLEVGDVLDMKYYPKDLYQPPVILKTQIKHISLEDQGRFKGHYLVGLLTLRAVRPPTDDPRMG